MQVDQPGHDLLQRDAQVHPGQVGAGAAVGAGAEGDVAVGRPIEVDAVGVHELTGITRC